MKRPHTMRGAFRRLRYHLSILRLRILDEINFKLLVESTMLLVLLLLCVLAFGCANRTQEQQHADRVIQDPILSNQGVHVDRFWRVIENSTMHGDAYLLRSLANDKCYLVLVTHSLLEHQPLSTVVLDHNAPCLSTRYR